MTITEKMLPKLILLSSYKTVIIRTTTGSHLPPAIGMT